MSHFRQFKPRAELCQAKTSIYGKLQGVPENCLRSTISAISFRPLNCQKSFTTHFNPGINTSKMNGELAF